MNISMCDIVAEKKAYKEAFDLGIITGEMRKDADNLSIELGKLCLRYQVETYNKIVAELKKPISLAKATATPTPVAIKQEAIPDVPQTQESK